MTEQEYLDATNPQDVWTVLHELKVPTTERKVDLYLAACCRTVNRRLVRWRSWLALDVLERNVEGEATPEERAAALALAEDAVEAAQERFDAQAGNDFHAQCERAATLAIAEAIRDAVDETGEETDEALARGHAHAESLVRYTGLQLPDIAAETFRRLEREKFAECAALLREVFGNPFQIVALRDEWRTSTVVNIATTAYAARDFAALPILADALEEAGCDAVALLEHLRGPGPHVRGCWALDLLRGETD